MVNPITLPSSFRLYDDSDINTYLYMRGLGPDTTFGPTGFYPLDFFCSGIQLYVLLNHYPCFISILYLDLYVLGDESWIS